jgi:predicted CXXCH cytochrome family protein
MKSRFSLTVPALLAVAGLTAARAEITGSAHDFSNETWAQNQICLPCHTPHGANTTVADSPLWNHKLSTAAYTMYSSATMNSVPGQPDGRSKLCLSCHDGTVALDSFGASTGTHFLSASDSAYIGTDLRNDHPVSITYNTALANTDGELHDPATRATALGGTIAQKMLFNGKLECASCHDVHNAQNNEGLLLINNAGSALCLTCHDK